MVDGKESVGSKVISISLSPLISLSLYEIGEFPSSWISLLLLMISSGFGGIIDMSISMA